MGRQIVAWMAVVGMLTFGLPSALAQPAHVTEEVVAGLKNDPSINPEVLQVALAEIVPAIQADPLGAEAHIVGAIAEAICCDLPEGVITKLCATHGGCLAHGDAAHSHTLLARERFEFERPEKERQEHDHSAHSHHHEEEG